MNHRLSQAHWFKSSRCKDVTACVEIAHLTDDLVGVHDSENPTGTALIFTPSEWDAFNTRVQNGSFDRV
jgi:hypothetical protein